MPITCPGDQKPRYRVKGGSTGVRLAFCGSQVVETKSLKSGKVHTPSEFKQDRLRSKAKKKAMRGK